jgi:beta-lactamase regulating signal transducer with metallopeptidase domain
MIAAWMLAATALGLLAAVTALAAERALRLLNRQGRGVWVVALAVTCAWPVLAPALRRPVEQSVQIVALTASAGVSLASASELAAPSLKAGDRLAPFDTPLLVVWVALSTLLLAHAAVAVHSLRQLARSAERRAVDGRDVLITLAVGPAAFGILRPRIVLPSWSLELDRSMRELVLRHEAEHVAAADPAVLVLAWLLTALMPWNLSLWWILRRLRTATELDCDCRVLRGRADTRRYAHLLMLIAQRQGPATFASMIAGSPSTLSVRISAIHSVPPRRPVLRAAGLMLGSLIVGAAAASPALGRELARVRDRVVSARPSSVVPATRLAVAPPSRPGGLPATSAAVVPPRKAPPRPRLATRVLSPVVVTAVAQVAVKKMMMVRAESEIPGSRSVTGNQVVPTGAMTAPRYPRILKQAGVTGRTVVQFVVDTTGAPDLSSVNIVQSAHELFTEAVKNSLPTQHFLPARAGSRKLRQLVQYVYRFEILGRPLADSLAVPSAGVSTFEVVITAVP